MPNVRELLERESTTVDLEHGHFERMLRRRDRKRRNERIGAGALAIILALVSFVALARVFGNAEPADEPVEPTPFSQVHGWIAFRDGSEIIAVDPSDPANRISLGPSAEADPIAWSKDGKRLLLRAQPEAIPSFHGGDWWWSASGYGKSLVLVDQDGSMTDLPRNHRRSAWGLWGSFSPDGTEVAYACCGSSRGPYVVDVDGGRLRELGDPCEREDIGGRSVELCGEPVEEWAAWSPDGTQIAWLDFVEDSVAFGHHAQTLSFVRPDGSGLRPEAVHLPGDAGGLVWSPDGSQLAFWMVVPEPGADPSVEGLDTEFPAQIFVIDADGSGLRQITEHGDNRWPAWSPDGSRIAFARGRLTLKTGPDGSQAAFVLPGTRHLFTVALDGSDPQQIGAVTPDGAIAWNPVRGADA